MLDYWRVPQIRKKKSRHFLGRIHFSGGTKLLSSLHRCLWNIVHLANMFAIVPWVTPPQPKVNVSVYMLVAVGCTWGSVVANIPSKIASINAPYNVSGSDTMSTPPRYVIEIFKAEPWKASEATIGYSQCCFRYCDCMEELQFQSPKHLPIELIVRNIHEIQETQNVTWKFLMLLALMQFLNLRYCEFIRKMFQASKR